LSLLQARLGTLLVSSNLTFAEDDLFEEDDIINFTLQMRSFIKAKEAHT
jgi:hypothetical protein